MSEVPIHHCPSCGRDVPSLDPIDCPGCGTRLEWPDRSPLRPPPVIDPARAAFGDYVRHLKRNQRAPGTAAEVERKAAQRADHRREVHRLRNEGLSIAQTASRLEISQSYVSKLRREPLD